MPDPEAVAVVSAFRRRLLALDARTLKSLIDAYVPIWATLEAQVEAIAADPVRLGGLSRDERVRDLQRQVEREVDQYATKAGGTISTAQRGAVNIAGTAARRTVEAALPDGITLDTLANVGIQWNRLPASAFEQFVGFAGDGGPLARLLAPLGPEAALGVKDALAQGIALGASPRETSRLVRDQFGLPLTRSLTISRTETLRSYREATRTQYQANSNIVKGYKRISAKDDRVCLACLALDGTEQPTDEVMPTHPNCRCAAVPITVSYRDLGLDVPEDTRESESAQQWFEAQPETVQRGMMGETRFTAWQRGEFQFGDMATVTDDATWGPGVQITPLGELIG